MKASRQWMVEHPHTSIAYESVPTTTVIGEGLTSSPVACIDFGNVRVDDYSACMHAAYLRYKLKVAAKDGRLRVSVPYMGLVQRAYTVIGTGEHRPQSEIDYLVVEESDYIALAKKVLSYGDEIAVYATRRDNEF